jgi:hypothetical protein
MGKRKGSRNKKIKRKEKFDRENKVEVEGPSVCSCDRYLGMSEREKNHVYLNRLFGENIPGTKKY